MSDFPTWHTNRKASDPPKMRPCPKCGKEAAKHRILCINCLAQ